MKHNCFLGLNYAMESYYCGGNLIYFIVNMNNNSKLSVLCEYHFNAFENKSNENLNCKKITEEQYNKLKVII